MAQDMEFFHEIRIWRNTRAKHHFESECMYLIKKYNPNIIQSELASYCSMGLKRYVSKQTLAFDVRMLTPRKAHPTYICLKRLFSFSSKPKSPYGVHGAKLGKGIGGEGIGHISTRKPMAGEISFRIIRLDR